MVNNLLKMMIMVMVAAFAAGYASAQLGSKGPVLLEIVDGDTAFAVDPGRNKAYWLTGECRREIPMGQAAKGGANGALLSQKISDKVTLGRSQVVLEQQFKFNLTSAPVTVEVYNSVRGGWVTIPVRLNAECSAIATCRSRMEIADC